MNVVGTDPLVESTAKERRIEGTVSDWVAERGFGWVHSVEGSLFAHIREFPKGRVPLKGDEVTFITGKDPAGRVCATKLILKKAHEGPGLWACTQLAVLLVMPVLAGFKLPGPGWVLPFLMLVVSVFAWICYRGDKKAAATGAWRISETALHSLELLGGWPGAFLAQQRYRHKTRKASYQAIFQSIVFLYQLAALDTVLDHHLWAQLVQALAESGMLEFGL